jgi:hypothetical protein
MRLSPGLGGQEMLTRWESTQFHVYGVKVAGMLFYW